MQSESSSRKADVLADKRIWKAVQAVHRLLKTLPDTETRAVVLDDYGTLRALKDGELQFEISNRIVTPERVVGHYNAQLTAEMLLEDIADMPDNYWSR